MMPKKHGLEPPFFHFSSDDPLWSVAAAAAKSLSSWTRKEPKVALGSRVVAAGITVGGPPAKR